MGKYPPGSLMDRLSKGATSPEAQKSIENLVKTGKIPSEPKNTPKKADPAPVTNNQATSTQVPGAPPKPGSLADRIAKGGTSASAQESIKNLTNTQNSQTQTSTTKAPGSAPTQASPPPAGSLADRFAKGGTSPDAVKSVQELAKQDKEKAADDSDQASAATSSSASKFVGGGGGQATDPPPVSTTAQQAEKIEKSRSAERPAVYDPVQGGGAQTVSKDMESWLILASKETKSKAVEWVKTLLKQEADDDYQNLLKETLDKEKASIEVQNMDIEAATTAFKDWRKTVNIKGFENVAEVSWLMTELQTGMSPTAELDELNHYTRLLEAAENRLQVSKDSEATRKARLNAWAMALNTY